MVFSATDDLSGARDYDMQYKVGATGPWTAWLTDTTVVEAPFVGTSGYSYTFRVKATDNVNNTNPDWIEAGPVTVKGVTKYYTHGGQRVAMNRGGEVYYLHGDHLGSTSLTTDRDGNVVSEVRYEPYGEERWANGEAVTDFGFTSQRAEKSFGLIDYQARFYSPYLNRFISPDPIIPGAGNPQVLNHYSYVKNNPLRFNDPSGNFCWGQPGCAIVGAVIIVAEGVDPLPFDVVSIPTGGSMILSDPLLSNFVATYGPQLPAYMDTVYQAAEGADAAGQSNQNTSNGGNSNNADPGGKDPWNRYRNLGTDETGQFRQAEADAAARLEQKVGELQRFNSKIHPTGKYGDWIDAQGRTYDAVGPVPNAARHFDLNSFVSQIDKHLLKQGVDNVVVDFTGLNPTQISAVQNHLNNLASEELNRIITLGLP